MDKPKQKFLDEALGYINMGIYTYEKAEVELSVVMRDIEKYLKQSFKNGVGAGYNKASGQGKPQKTLNKRIKMAGLATKARKKKKIYWKIDE